MIDIEHCRLRFQCTQRWEQLDPVPGTTSVRFCVQCQSDVHLVETDSEFDQLAAQGKCMAFRSGGRLMVGEPTAPPWGSDK